MINKRLLTLIAIVSASCSASPDDVDDFNTLSSSLSKEKSSSQMRMSNEKLARIVESLPQESGSPFLSHFIHSGNNLFFKPNIVLGSKMENPFVSRDALEKNKAEIKEKSKMIKKHENKEKISTTTTTTTTTTIAPTTTTLTTVGITEKIGKFSEHKQKEKIKIPEPPVLAPLIMPKLPIILRESEPAVEPIMIPQPPTFVNLNLPPADIFPANVEIVPPYLPLHFRDSYVIQDPCVTLPAIPQNQGIHEKISAEKYIIPPKLPELIPMQLPVPVVPFTQEIVGSRFTPYVDVSKISMENIDRKSLQIPSWHLPQVLSERIPLRKEKDATINIPSLSAFCAHNIALERALPNILRNKEKINDPYLPHWIYP